MIATELMIGDWVYNTHNQKNEKVCEIDSRLVMLDYNDLYEYDEVQPIPLTPEILERNGWEYNDENEKFAPETWTGGGLMLKSDDDGFMIVTSSDYDDEDTNNTPFTLRYVHELQHALHLRHLDKEIAL